MEFIEIANYSLDNICFDFHPDRKYIASITKHMIATSDDRSRTGTENEIWGEGFDKFYFLVAIDRMKDDAIGAVTISMDYSVSGEPLFMIGSVYVKEEYRGLGIGGNLCQLAVDSAEGHNIGLNAAKKMTKMYEKFGFILYDGRMKIQTRLDTSKIRVDKSLACPGVEIRDLEEVDWMKVEEYDQTISGRRREKYLKLWLHERCAVTKVAICTQTGAVVGFACARRQIQSRYVVGPFYAENEEIARVLTHQVLSNDKLMSAEQVWFRFPETNAAAFRILDELYDGNYEKIPRSMSHFNKKMIKSDNDNRIFAVFDGSHSVF